MPRDCKFITVPRLLKKVTCGTDVQCKLAESVSNTETYNSVKGFNLEATISSSASVGVVEIGGEISAGAKYECEHSLGLAKTSTVECTEESKAVTALELYNIQSNVQCWFGLVTMHKESRWENGWTNMAFEHLFTTEELQSLEASAGIDNGSKDGQYFFMVDVEKIPKDLLQALKDKLRFNPSTDFFIRQGTTYGVYYFGNPTKSTTGVVKTIPFTTPEGNAIHQWACLARD